MAAIKEAVKVVKEKEAKVEAEGVPGILRKTDQEGVFDTEIITKLTWDYDIFINLKCNRDLIEGYRKALRESFSEEYLRTILFVTPYQVVGGKQFYAIIDGQHRVDACAALGLPVLFQVVEDYGEEQILLFNLTSSKWSANRDTVSAQIKQDNPDYIVFAQYRDKYRLNNTITKRILSGNKDRNTGGQTKKQNDDFTRGKFKATNKVEAEFIGDCVLSLAEYSSLFKKRSFVYALSFIIDQGKYDQKRMLLKAKFFAGKLLTDAKNIKEALDQLETLYNFKQKTERCFYGDTYKKGEK